MRNLICLLFLSISFSFYGQNKNADLYLPPYAEAGKCYMMCFDYNSKVEWLEKSCDSLKYRKPEENLVFKGEKASNYIKSRIKFKKYQDKLISLGLIFAVLLEIGFSAKRLRNARSLCRFRRKRM